MIRWTPFALIFVLEVASTATVAAQDIERVRALYVAAAYEEALAAIPSATPAAVKLEVEQYRALCLLALGREDEAATTVEGIVRDHPTYLPSERDTSPRLQSIFAAARLKLLPDLARQAYSDGKTAFEAKDGEAARTAFQRAISIVESLPESDRGPLGDLALLAAGFLDLAASRAVPEAVPEKPAAPAPLPYVAPVAIDEQMPPWNPPDSASMRTEYLGLLRVSIGEDGRVLSAEVVKSSHPSYDVVVARAARDWRYKPATRGGQPVASQKDIQIRLVPR
jgi:protein TonB